MIEFKLDGTIVTANQNFLDAMGYTLTRSGNIIGMFIDASERDSTAYREFWAKLDRGEFQAAHKSSARAAARSGSRRPTTRSSTPTAGPPVSSSS